MSSMDIGVLNGRGSQFPGRAVCPADRSGAIGEQVLSWAGRAAAGRPGCTPLSPIGGGATMVGTSRQLCMLAVAALLVLPACNTPPPPTPASAASSAAGPTGQPLPAPRDLA